MYEWDCTLALHSAVYNKSKEAPMAIIYINRRLVCVMRKEFCWKIDENSYRMFVTLLMLDFKFEKENHFQICEEHKLIH